MRDTKEEEWEVLPEWNIEIYIKRCTERRKEK